MENKLNVQKLGYEVGEPMWVHWDEEGTRRVKDTIHIPMSLVASFGSFD